VGRSPLVEARRAHSSGIERVLQVAAGARPAVVLAGDQPQSGHRTRVPDGSIARERPARIIAGTKKIEYRQIKPYWTERFEKASVPFELRLLNGMNRPVPEVTVLIHKITKDRHAGEYQLPIKKVVGFKHWDKRRQKPNGESSM
jgi:hypothetical protein